MKKCPNCHHQAKDDALYCPVCGTMLDAVPQPDAEYFKTEPVQISVPTVPVHSAYDHTEDYSPDDIRVNKLPCMILYLLDFIGVIIALLMCSSSAYAQFHVRQSLKFIVLESLIILSSILFFWTFVVPVVGIILLAVLLVIKFLCFLDVCNGKAKEPPIIRNLKFLN